MAAAANGDRGGETHMWSPVVALHVLEIPALLGFDPLFVLLAAGFLGLFFFGFLLLRRTVMGFKEGVDRGKR